MTAASTASGSLVAAEQRLASLQNRDGSWQAEVVWSPIVTAQVVIAQAITGRIRSKSQRRLTLLHFRHNKRPDGGWGLHAQSRSYVFVTTLVYIAARLLGAPADDEMLVNARAFLKRTPDGVLANPQWGRFWLSLIGLYDRGALNACPPELFLLGRGSAISPLRFYCHTRSIYLAMAYLSGSGFKADLGPLAAALRQELPGLDQPGNRAHSVPVAASDLHEAPGLSLELAYAAMRWTGPLWRAMPGAGALRKRALARCLGMVRDEQRSTTYQALSPVSGVLNTLSLYANSPGDPDVQKSLDGMDSWQWSDEEDGLRYAGARSTAWDTSFALQALTDGGEPSARVNAAEIRRGYRALCTMQLRSELPDRTRQHRDINLGGWCFTEGLQQWPVSDCTAEAVVALTNCHAYEGLIAADERIPDKWLGLAAGFILSRQNDDGGFGSYERRRGRPFLEKLNPSEMFGRCMTELSYVECTASSIRALHRLLDAKVVDAGRLHVAIERGKAVILSRQRSDGSWPGFWGINFIYGTLFALTALREVGLPTDHPAIERARAWLEDRQKPDGGWGEHFDGCATGRYVDNPESLVISTAWATLALLCTRDRPLESAKRGCAWLESAQLASGDWPRDSVNGVFFGTAMLDYRLYNTFFPLMALARLGLQSHG